MLDRIRKQSVTVSALVVTVALLTAANRGNAAPTRDTAPSATRDSAAVRTATLQVENDGFSDRIIYVSMDGVRQRLGTARGASTTTFTIPRIYVNQSPAVRFIAEPFASFSREVSRQVYVFPGDTVDMVIEGWS